MLSEKDNGLYDAMNKGLAKARELGDGFVNFMNAGDTFASADVCIRGDGKPEDQSIINVAGFNAAVRRNVYIKYEIRTNV